MRYASRSKVSTATKPKGQPTVKPPRGEANDGNYAHLYSGNILYDPGVELFVGNAVGSYSIHRWRDHTGNRTFMLPNYEPLCDFAQIWPNDDCVTYWDIAQWVSQGGGYAPDGGLDSLSWNVTRVDPYLGDYAMAWWRWTEGPGGNPLSLMIQAPGLPGGYSARVQPGDSVAFSVQSKMHPNVAFATGGEPKISVLLYYYNQSGGAIVGGGSFYEAILSSAYTEYSYDTVAPGGAYFVRAFLSFTADNPGAWDPDGAGGYDPSVLVDSGILSVE